MMEGSLDEDLIKKIKWLDLSSEEKQYATPWERTKAKIKKNPFVPLGMLCTVTVLVMGINSFRKGNSVRSQLFMRWRVTFQSLTIISIMCGLATEKIKN